MIARTALTALFGAGLVAVHLTTGYAGLRAEELAALSPFFCPLYRFGGVQCPTCGLTRSVLSAALGRFDDAFAFHPLGPFLLFGVATAIALWWIRPAWLSRAWRATGSTTFRRLAWPAVVVYCVWGFLLR